jgi:hypothetical protein
MIFWRALFHARYQKDSEPQNAEQGMWNDEVKTNTALPQPFAFAFTSPFCGSLFDILRFDFA